MAQRNSDHLSIQDIKEKVRTKQPQLILPIPPNPFELQVNILDMKVNLNLTKHEKINGDGQNPGDFQE